MARKQLKDSEGVDFYPYTDLDSVIDSDNNTLSDILAPLIDDVLVDAAYITANGVSSFTDTNKRYCITEQITLASSTSYTVGANSILHFNNNGKIVTDSTNPATLTFTNTQIEAPMK